MTKGRFWKIFIVSIFCSVPTYSLLLLSGITASQIDIGQFAMDNLVALLYAISALVTCTVCSAAAAHIYRALEHPSPPPIPKLEPDKPATVELAAS